MIKIHISSYSVFLSLLHGRLSTAGLGKKCKKYEVRVVVERRWYDHIFLRTNCKAVTKSSYTLHKFFEILKNFKKKFKKVCQLESKHFLRHFAVQITAYAAQNITKKVTLLLTIVTFLIQLDM